MKEFSTDNIFKPEKYWQERVSGRLDIGVVGHRSFGRAYNSYIYQRRIDLISDFLCQINVDLTKLKVLDIGCGSGFYVDFWKSKGIKEYVGLDISKDSVNQLKARYPNYRFIHANITLAETLSKITETYDIITVFDVMYHIIDDTRASMAFKMMEKWLSEKGNILIFDQLLERDFLLTSHVKFRGRQSYQKLLQDAGLRINHHKQMFLLLVPPVFGIKYLDIMISGGYKCLGFFTKSLEWFGNILGYSFYHLDNLILRVGVHIPNHELLIIKKIG